MRLIAGAVVVILLALGALHFYWGLGGRWPGHDDRTLVEMVVGRTKNMRAPNFWACLFVTACLVASAALVMLYAGLAFAPLPSWMQFIVSIGFWTAGAMFLARGIAGFVPGVFRYAEGTPFAHLNLAYYSPLCLLVAVGFVAVHFTTNS